ncbi:MAG: hypothetical protein Q7T12_06545 [Flavobacterium sp.]|nr:hypothetical protein [Flavobacterium sp.]
MNNNYSLVFNLKKVIIALFLLVFSIGFSQNQRCTIYLKDNTSVTGLGKIKTDGNIKFKVNSESESSIYEAALIDRIEMNEKGTNETYKYKKLNNNFEQWLKVIIEGRVNLYKSDVSGMYFAPGAMNTAGGFGGMSYGGGGNVTHYYINHEGESEVFKITSFGNISKNFKNAASDFFKDCPVLVKKIQNKTYTKNDIEEVVEFYNENCN